MRSNEIGPGSEALSSDATEQASGSSASFTTGSLVEGRFKVKRLVSSQGLIATYSAQDLESESKVFIETLDESAAASHRALSACRSAFLRAATEATALTHENIFPITAFELETEPTFLLKDYSNVIQLSELVSSSGPVEDPFEAAEILLQVCKGLAQAHSADITHGALGSDLIYLTEEAGAVRVQIDGFGLSALKAVSDESGLMQRPTKQRDVCDLALLAFFVFAGKQPDGSRGGGVDVKADRDNLALTRSFQSLIDERSDVPCVEELVQLLEDTFSVDESERVSSVEEFEGGLLDWREAVAAARQSGIAEQLSGAEHQVARSGSGEPRRTTKDLTSAVRHMVILRQKQINQEESVIMKLTDLPVGSGSRLSPSETVFRLIMLALALSVLVGASLYIVNRWKVEIRSAWFEASDQLAALASRKDAEDSSFEENDDVDSPSKIEGTAKTAQQKRQQSGAVHTSGLPDAGSSSGNAARARRNKVRPFVASELRNLYHGDHWSEGSDLRKGKRPSFRIEYRKFDYDWLK